MNRRIGLTVRSLLLPIILTLLSYSSVAQTEESTPDSIFISNIHSKATTGGAKLSWNLPCEAGHTITTLALRYRRSIEDESDWRYLKLDNNLEQYKIKGLKEGEKYKWELGFAKNGSAILEKELAGRADQMKWTSAQSFETERGWGLFRFMFLIGALGMFIYGMKIMSEGLQQGAGNRLRSFLSAMTANKYLGVLSGFVITGLVQSSSATTVMTISFVNAGLLTLVESAGVMMGANIGTTITGWLISIFGFKVSISSYALIFLAMGAPLLFIKRSNYKSWGNAIIGFALLFMGLGFLKEAVPTLEADSPIILFFSEYSDVPFLGRILFVLLGAFVTIIIQSSSAAMALTLTLVDKNIIPFEVGAAMILGENIGTTITAELASLIGNVHAKRSARIHSMFNIVGVSWMVILMPIFLHGIELIVPGDPYTSGESATLALAAFHTVFNATNVLIMIWLVDFLVKLAIKTVPSKGEDDEIYRLEYISGGMSATPELSIIEAQKEVIKLGEIDRGMTVKIRNLINETDKKKVRNLIDKINNYERITDNLYNEITDYLLKLSRFDMTETSSRQLRSILSISNDLEHIGDMLKQMKDLVEKKMEDNVWFNQKQRSYLNQYLETLLEGFDIMIENLNAPYDSVTADRAIEVENELNVTRDKLRKKHLKHLEKGEYPASSGLVYSNLLASIERVGDMILSVTEGITGVNIE